jgi:4-hydroxythreonine-4-phosphate dehydrogenase
MNKPIIGISQGDPNGVGLEVIIKTFQHPMMYEHCIPVLYANPKTFSFHKKILGMETPSYVPVRDISEIKGNQLNLISINNEAVEVNAGIASEAAGNEALRAIDRMLQDAKNNKLHAMVTAPVDKSTIKTASGFTGHTSYITDALGVDSSLMVLYSDDIKIGLVTEHLPIPSVSGVLKKDLIISKLTIANDSLKRDFGIIKPKIAVLGLNPHNGDNGTMGTEEKDVIIPAINEAKAAGIFCFGPYSADGFFGMKSYHKFDMVIAMYHDQGLIPFKSMAFDDGVNYTAGLPVLRTSPDHGTAYDIAGKNIASPQSFSNAVFAAIDLYHRRHQTDHLKSNPLGFSELRRERFRLEQG